MCQHAMLATFTLFASKAMPALEILGFASNSGRYCRTVVSISLGVLLLRRAGDFFFEEAFTGREGTEVTGLRALSISSDARARANSWRRADRAWSEGIAELGM